MSNYTGRRADNGARGFWLLVVAAILVSFMLIFLVSPQMIGKVVKAIFTLVLLVAIVLALVELWPRVVNRRNRRRLSDAWFAITRWARARPMVVVGIIVAIILVRTTGYIVVRHTWAAPTQPEMVVTGLTYYREMAGRCRVQCLEVDLNKVKPQIMVPSNFSSGKKDLTTLAEESNVMAAVNGDLFDSGGPQGLLASGGRLTAPNAERAALKFTDNGRQAEVELFRFSTTAGVSVNGVTFPIRRSYNALYVPGDIGVYTANRGIASGARSAKHVLQARVSLSPGQREGAIRLAGVITEIQDDSSVNMTPQPDEIILMAGNEKSVPDSIGVYGWAATNWRQDAPVRVDLPMTPSPGSTVIGGAPEIMREHQYIVQEEKNDWCLSHTARTVVGITEDRQHLLVIVAEGPPKFLSRSPKESLSLFPRALFLRIGSVFPGFNGISAGMSTQDVYNYLSGKTVAGQSIAYAINLDGGDSATMVVDRMGEINCVSATMGGKERPLANGLGFVPR